MTQRPSSEVSREVVRGPGYLPCFLAFTLHLRPRLALADALYLLGPASLRKIIVICTLHYPFMKNILVCLLAALGVTAFAQTTIYINPSATVSNPNGSLASPYTDFNDAIVAAEAGGGGDVLIVGGDARDR